MDKYTYNEQRGNEPEIYEQERDTFLQKINDIAVEHVGSTAIKNLGGKGIIDILLGVPDTIQTYVEILTACGYEFREKASTPERLFFRKDIAEQRVHVHLTKKNSQDWKEMIAFRNYLRANPSVAEEYAKIKQEAVNHAEGNGEVYKNMKLPFIQRITAKALTSAGAD